jgi:hypothetical protein
MSSLEKSHQSKSQTIQNICEFEQYNELSKMGPDRERKREETGQIERDVSPTEGFSLMGFSGGRLVFWCLSNQKAGQRSSLHYILHHLKF